MEEQPVGTRARILQAAEQLFVERGFHAATLQEVADRVGITKPALYYHFDSKSEILGHLLDPMTAELDQVVTDSAAAAESGGITAVRTVLMTGWTDVFLRSRGALLALVRDLASTPSGTYTRLLAVVERAVETAAGPDAGIAEQIAVTQAISAITDPIALIPQVPTDVLREHLLAGVWRLLGEPHTATGATRRGGRPRTLSTEDASRIRELHASGEHSAGSIAAQLGVSRATVYRYLKTEPH